MTYMKVQQEICVTTKTVLILEESNLREILREWMKREYPSMTTFDTAYQYYDGRLAQIHITHTVIEKETKL